MAGRFPYSRPERRGLNDPWFRIGDVDIGSAAFLALLCAVSILVYGFEPADKPILTSLALLPSEVRSGQIWRIVTWPLANGLDQRLLWVAVAVALLWYFGSRLEEEIGRVRMTVLLGALIVLPGLLATLLDIPHFGVRSIEIAVLLIFIAEYPNLRFFFGIPAWALGIVYVVTDILQISGSRAGDRLLFYLISLVIAALAARAVGLLTAYPWIPQTPLPAALTGGQTSRKRSRPKRSTSSGPSVVAGPWATGPSAQKAADEAAAQRELDALLDKISATGLDSLSAAERKRLTELSKRQR